MATKTRSPTGDGTPNDWSALGGGSKYVEVDEAFAAPDDDATYIYRQDSAGQQRFTFAAFDVPVGSAISNVVVRWRDIRSAAGTATSNGVIAVNGTVYVMSGAGVGTSWTNRTRQWNNNPDTGSPWTVADVNGTGSNPLQAFEIRVSAMASGREVRVTFADIIVNYEPPQEASGAAPALVWGVGTCYLASDQEAAADTAPAVAWGVGQCSLVAEATVSGGAPTLAWGVGTCALVSENTISGDAPSAAWGVGLCSLVSEAAISGDAPALAWGVGTCALLSENTVACDAPSMAWGVGLCSLVAEATISGDAPAVAWGVGACTLSVTGDQQASGAAPALVWGLGVCSLVAPDSDGPMLGLATARPLLRGRVVLGPLLKGTSSGRALVKGEHSDGT